MNQPSVCAVMLTKDRVEMTRQAVASFEAQTYPNKKLRIFDTSDRITRYARHFQCCQPGWPKRGVGQLRNEANALSDEDILIHFDSDDISHPNRIAEQVELLQESGADCVGYNECLFWSTPPDNAWMYRNPNPHYAVGASLCYWRRVWEHKPFPDLPVGEDTAWLAGLNVRALSSLPPILPGLHDDARLVCRIHGRNTNKAYSILLTGKCTEFQRAPEWDTYCREVVA